MRHIVLSYVTPSRSTILFNIISSTARFSGGGGGNIEHKICFDFFYNFCLNISHSKKHLAIYCQKRENVFMYKVPLFFLMKRIFSTYFGKISNVNFIKIRPVGAELFHTDGQTDMAKLTVAFRNFANATPKKYGS
jgi:hypothetical protein